MTSLNDDLRCVRYDDPIRGVFGGIVGDSDKMNLVFKLIHKIKNSDVPILITGESGTGKELVAKAIHNSSPRQKRRFIAENCSALPDTLLESEFFGHVKGSFTGAVCDKKGLFEEADNGTLFLDEVGDMSTLLQKKLLRVLQESVVRRVGGTHEIPVNVRVISATNRDLVAMVKAGMFREDLFYRLNVIEIQMPPLRDRPEDIWPIVHLFVQQHLVKTGCREFYVEKAVIERLKRYRWPGNVRELENLIKKLIALSDDNTITLDDLVNDERFNT